MSVLTQPVKPQNFTIEGIKFFKKHLEKIELDSQVTDHPITTSEISLYMILHLYTDEMGEIRSFTKDPDVSDRKLLCISNIASEHSLTYETVKKAFDKLIERKYIQEVYTEFGMHYEIVDFAKYNQLIASKNPDRSTYFHIPLALFKEKVFGQLIKQRYHKGPILLLKLCEFFQRQIGTNRRLVEDVELVKGDRTMSYLKKTLNTTAKRVRNFLSIINNVFSFIPVDKTLKTPSKDRMNRRREFVQVCIEKFNFTLNSACYKKIDEKSQRKTFATWKKEMSARIKNAKIPLKFRDKIDIEKSISRMVNYSVHFEVVNLSKDMLGFTISSVADTLEELHIKGQLKSIKSIGRFANSQFTKALFNFKEKYMDESDVIEIGHAYNKTYGTYPDFLTPQNANK
ncbi:hypothetical protein ACQRXC_28870 (plasmid) [Niallia taxi]|uniref:hypothetical protein n=1 Tax=Niallia TaxID=2837506 RepID=UPI0015F6AA66|nr:hypothetical protein [Niallia taxi]MED4057221.1 hypothetical protein [Niallia taxi]MED4122182.1 hypothetical protein [Niallia taxi]